VTTEAVWPSNNSAAYINNELQVKILRPT